MTNFDPFRQNAPQGAPQPVPFPPQQMPPGYPQPIPLQPQYQPQPTFPQPAAYPQQAAYPQPGYPQQGGYPQQPAPYYPQPAAYPAPVPIPLSQPQPIPLSYAPAPQEAAPIPLSTRQTPQPVRVAPVPVPLPAQQPAPAPVTARVTTPANRPLPATPENLAAKAAAALPLPAKPQPIPANRPLLAPVKTDAGAKGGIPKIEKAKPEDEPPPDPTQKVVKSTPPWMISMVVHMVMVIIMALIFIPVQFSDQIFLESEPIWAEKEGKQVLEDKLESPESMEMEVPDPALTFDDKPADDPLADAMKMDVNLLDATTATSDMTVPTIGSPLDGREEGAKKALMAAYGGTASTEAAVREGLLWLKRNQKEDGSWSLTGPYSNGGYSENRVAATAMALLAFQGAGHTHQKAGEFKGVVDKGWKALLAMENADGEFQGESAYNHKTYAQAQATIAICEIYGMTKDKAFRDPAQKAVNYAINSQSPQGGWRYSPKEDSDTSVTGWYVMALQSAQMAGLDVPSPVFDKITAFLDSVSHENQSKYGYMTGQDYRLSMTAEGLLCRQYLGWKHDDERLRSGVNYLLANPIDYTSSESHQNVYYWYYATQTMHHMDGADWNKWNQVMRQEVPSHQIKSGAEKGSWTPANDPHGAGAGGRLYTTCLSIYMLEVYYRHLPIYKYRIK